MQLLEDGFKFVFRKDGLNDPLQNDDDKPLVEGVVLQHVEQHVEAESAGLAADHPPQLVRQAGEERGTRRHTCPHPLRLVTWRHRGRGKTTRPEIVLRRLRAYNGN